MKLLSRQKCDKGHFLEYFHNMGSQWCLWCPKCKKTGYTKQNFYRWEFLSKIDDILESLSLFAWINRILRLKRRINDFRRNENSS